MTSSISEQDWYLDTGASHHMTVDTALYRIQNLTKAKIRSSSAMEMQFPSKAVAKATKSRIEQLIKHYSKDHAVTGSIPSPFASKLCSLISPPLMFGITDLATPITKCFASLPTNKHILVYLLLGSFAVHEKITLLLCDYRQLSKSQKYDRIISCEMIEAVGHEYMEEFFSCCEKFLAEDGIFVLQFISVPDQRYEEQRKTPGFVRDIIFPGGCLPSLNRVVSAMTSSSQLCVEHLENIGIHYFQGLMLWRENLMTNKCKIIALGFDERFIRKWEYYFMYCAAGFKSRIIGNYQVVFSRPGNLKAFKDSYKGISSVMQNNILTNHANKFI